uniref:Uncharacterized protein n=1 Tax=Nothobranchius furzeri TaxID=105023 RepID=A0A8C6KUH5_NOTFU
SWPRWLGEREVWASPNSRGNRPAAERYSSTAKTLNLVALILGVLAIISSVVIIAVSLALY